MDKVICVYSSSSNTIDQAYFEAASLLGEEIAVRGDVLLFGGGLTGLMGTCARAVHRQNGKVIGVIPEALNETGIVYEGCDELVVTTSMRKRKTVMDERSDAFIALPGGFGTVEEIMEIITLKQLRYHSKPIVILNVNGYYDALFNQFDVMIAQQFAKPACTDLYYITSDVMAALDYIDTYAPSIVQERWLTDVDKAAPQKAIVKAAKASADFDCCKIEIYIPKTHFGILQDTLRGVDAGHIGNYDSCLSYAETTGCWRPLVGSSPYDGEENVVSSAEELKVEVICLKTRVEETISAIKAVHPYEVPVINAIPLYKTGL